MEFQRAKEIIDSPETFHVHHKGTAVWIESLNAQDRTARVTGKTDQYTVSVDELIEQYMV